MSPRLSLRLLSAHSDERLLELVVGGHERAFEALVHRYRRALLAYCARLGIPEARREDVLQQALLKAWVALATGAEVRELRPWLYRIVHNTALNAIRTDPGNDHAQDTGAVVAVDAADEFEARLAAHSALSDVAALPTMQRSALLMSALDGRSHEEVASALGITSGAVRGLLYRARAALRSAAVALTPGWLLEWGSGAGRVVPSGARVAEITAGTGGDSAALLLKGAALAATAALAAGAALGPLRPANHHHAGPVGPGVASGHSSAASAGAAPQNRQAARGSDAVAPAASPRPSSGRAVARLLTGPRATLAPAGTRRRAGGVPEEGRSTRPRGEVPQTAQTPVTAAATPGPATAVATSMGDAGGGSEANSGSGSGSGSGAESETGTATTPVTEAETPTSTQPPAGEPSSDDPPPGGTDTEATKSDVPSTSTEPLVDH